LGNANDAPAWPGACFLSTHTEEPMLMHQLKRNLSLLLTATPSAAQSPSDTQAHSDGRAEANRRGSVESENEMSKWEDGSSFWMSSGVVTTARAASGM
jgi:hypothetical protein